MAIWIQSLSWALIYALAQGFLVYVSLWVVLKLVPAISSAAKYYLSLSALSIMLVWFVATWWQQYHALASIYIPHSAQSILIQQRLAEHGIQVAPAAYPTKGPWLPMLFPWLSAFYVIGVLCMLVRLSAGMWQVFSLRRTGISAPAAVFQNLLSSLQQRMQYKGYIRLYISARAQAPMVVGFLKPIILMPAAAMAQLSMEQLETILLHELAHVKRYDYFINILQTIVETLLFFNPFVWMVSSISRREREHCCDDMVLRYSGQPVYYATALATLASFSETTPAFAMAATRPSHLLFTRIKRIIEMKNNSFSYSRMIAAIVIITILSASALLLSTSFAQAAKKKAADEKPLTPEQYYAREQEKIAVTKQLIADHLILEVNGFSLTKRHNQIYINWMLQPDNVADKYLRLIKEDEFFMESYPFQHWQQWHPRENVDHFLRELYFPQSKPPAEGGC